MSKQWWENDPIASDDSSSKAGNWWEKDPVADGGAAPKKIWSARLAMSLVTLPLPL